MSLFREPSVDMMMIHVVGSQLMIRSQFLVASENKSSIGSSGIFVFTLPTCRAKGAITVIGEK